MTVQAIRVEEASEKGISVSYGYSRQGGVE